LTQEATTMSPSVAVPRDILPSQSLVALLALVGTKRMDAASLRSRTTLSATAFGRLLGWLQRGYLVDVVSTLEGDVVQETVQLTDKGESVLVSMLERTCELPELR